MAGFTDRLYHGDFDVADAVVLIAWKTIAEVTGLTISKVEGFANEQVQALSDKA